MKTIAIVLSAGKGKRMNSDVKKQYLLLDEKPILYYSLLAFEKSFVDEIIIVTGPDDREYVSHEIVKKYGFTKVSLIVTGGRERYHSVFNGLMASSACDYVFIHDGARPFITQDILNRALESVKSTNATAVGMPVKDTIKIVDKAKKVIETPNRNDVWLTQTPQCFAYSPIVCAYEDLLASETSLTNRGINITDDAMVMETFGSLPVSLTLGSYDNIKITTPDDLYIAEIILDKLKASGEIKPIGTKADVKEKKTEKPATSRASAVKK